MDRDGLMLGIFVQNQAPRVRENLADMGIPTASREHNLIYFPLSISLLSRGSKSKPGNDGGCASAAGDRSSTKTVSAHLILPALLLSVSRGHGGGGKQLGAARPS